jgi:predicted NBD/HSP70 family sugar kinase
MAVLDMAVNATRILNAIWSEPGISRIDLARRLNLNKSTITKIMQNLLDENLVRPAESSYVTDGKGRRPTGLYINEDLGVVLGVEIRTESWDAVVVNLRGDVVMRFPSGVLPPDTDMIHAMELAIESCIAQLRAEGKKVLGAGIGLSGQINPYEGIVLSSNPLKVHQSINVFEHMKSRFPFPVVVENDANCCCWKVMMEKRGRGDRNFLCVLGEFRRIGMGPEDGYSEIEGLALGLGLVIKDTVLHGDHYSAGEFQSVFKRDENPSQFDMTLKEVSSLRDDEELWRRVMGELARNIALLVNVLNITLIRVFGDFIRDPEYLGKILREEIDQNWLYDEPSQYAVEVTPDETNAVATGAAAYFLNRLYSIPDIHDEYSGSYPFGLELLRLALQSAN